MVVEVHHHDDDAAAASSSLVLIIAILAILVIGFFVVRMIQAQGTLPQNGKSTIDVNVKGQTPAPVVPAPGQGTTNNY